MMEGQNYTRKDKTAFGNNDLITNNEHSPKSEILENIKLEENLDMSQTNDKPETGNEKDQTSCERSETREKEINDVASQDKKLKKVKIDHAQLDELFNENVKKIHVCKLCKETFKKKKKLKKHMKVIHGIVKSKSGKINKKKSGIAEKPSDQKRKSKDNTKIHEEVKPTNGLDICEGDGITSLVPNKRKRRMVNKVISDENIESKGAADTGVTADGSINHPPKKKRKTAHSLKTGGESSLKTNSKTNLDLPSTDLPVENGSKSINEDLKDEVQQTASARIFTPKKTAWECKVCNESFDKKKNLTLHMKTHSNKSTTATPKPATVQKYDPHITDLQKEIPSPKLVAAKNASVCKNCFMTFEKQEDLDKHTEEKHKKDIDGEGDIEKKFKCEICGTRFRKKWTLQNHIKTHTGEKPYECDICDSKFSRMEAKLAHMIIHTGKKPFKCTICQAAFNQKGNLNSHMAIHSGSKPFKCPFCEASFISKTSMKEHMMLHTGEKVLRCDICNLKFLTEVRYKKHMEVHTNGEKPYKCDICFATFVLRLSYTQHMKKNIHNGDTEYKCPYCDLELTTEKRYNNHIRKHEEPSKMHKCDECFAEFGMKAALARHKQVHTGQRPYKCELCNASFAQSNSLRVHQRLHAGETPFKCEICDVTFYTKSAHSVHMKSHNISFDTGSFQVANFRFSEAIGLNLVERMKILQEGMEGKSDEDKEKTMKEEIDKMMEETYGSMMKKFGENNMDSSDVVNIDENNDTQEEINENKSNNPNDNLDMEGAMDDSDDGINVEREENTVDLRNKSSGESTPKSQVIDKATDENMSPVDLSEIKKEPITVEEEILNKKIVSPNKNTTPRKGFSIDSLIMRKMKPSEVQTDVQSLYSSEMDRLSESLK